MLREYYQAAGPSEAYNIGGGWVSNCSMKKAINLCESRTGKKMDLVYTDNNCISDHIWYISDTRKFQSHDAVWKQTHDLPGVDDEILESLWARVGRLSHLQCTYGAYSIQVQRCRSSVEKILARNS
jgi:CDP-paratose 2-epimerase